MGKSLRENLGKINRRLQHIGWAKINPLPPPKWLAERDVQLNRASPHFEVSKTLSTLNLHKLCIGSNACYPYSLVLKEKDDACTHILQPISDIINKYFF